MLLNGPKLIPDIALGFVAMALALREILHLLVQLPDRLERDCGEGTAASRERLQPPGKVFRSISHRSPDLDIAGTALPYPSPSTHRRYRAPGYSGHVEFIQ